jgi:hypothetical protein
MIGWVPLGAVVECLDSSVLLTSNSGSWKEKLAQISYHLLLTQFDSLLVSF